MSTPSGINHGQATISYTVCVDGPDVWRVELRNMPRDLFDAIPVEDTKLDCDDNRFPASYIKKFKKNGVIFHCHTNEGPDGRVEGVLDPEPRGVALPGGEIVKE